MSPAVWVETRGSGATKHRVGTASGGLHWVGVAADITCGTARFILVSYCQLRRRLFIAALSGCDSEGLLLCSPRFRERCCVQSDHPAMAAGRMRHRPLACHRLGSPHCVSYVHVT
jgi:hypothetical protein